MALEDHVVWNAERALAVIGHGYITVARLPQGTFSWRLFNQADRIIDSARGLESRHNTGFGFLSTLVEELVSYFERVVEEGEPWTKVDPFSSHAYDWLKIRYNSDALYQLRSEMRSYSGVRPAGCFSCGGDPAQCDCGGEGTI